MQLPICKVMYMIFFFAKQSTEKILAKYDSVLNNLYCETVRQSDKWKKIDEYTIGLPQWRGFWGLGCFTADSMIQIHKNGTEVLVSHIIPGSKVWNPVLEKEIVVKRTVYGPEFGFLWKFTCKSGHSVTVTQTHPMKILRDSMWENVAVKNVKLGEFTVSSGSAKDIVTHIEKIPIWWEWVYNLELDLPAEIPIHHRVIVSNKIHTLDLYAQGLNK